MAYKERPESKRLVLIAAWLEANLDVPAPTIHPGSVAWHITGRPEVEAAVLAITDNWKVMHRNGQIAYLTGYHSALGCVLLDVDRWATGMVERDWAELGIAVPAEVSA